MDPTRQVPREAQVAGILLETEAALGELHGYYKFGRHKGTFPEAAYLLLSHCGHLLFSLWRAEKESTTSTFEYSSYLKTLISNLDFEALAPTDDTTRTSHADDQEQCLKNDPKWFMFWLRVLETQDGTRPLNCQEFARSVLAYVSHPCFLEGKVAKKSRNTLTGLMKTNTVARTFRTSMSVLEEVTAAIIFRLRNLDQGKRATEQLASLICLLRQVRRMIVIETPAQGPYVLRFNKNWGLPPALLRMYGRRMKGTLKVVPKRDGGGVVCSYGWTSGSQPTSRSWIRDTSAFTIPYEEEIFRTWSYDTGEHLRTREPSTSPKAHWLVQSDEARRLQVLFWQMEAVLSALARNPRYKGLIADIARVPIDDQVDWHGGELEWTYVKNLDQLLNKLNLAYREARVLSGDNPGEEVIANMWPPQAPAAQDQPQHSEPQESDDAQALSEPSSVSPTAPQESEEPSSAETPAEDRQPVADEVETEQHAPSEPIAVEADPDSDATQHDNETPPSPPQCSMASAEMSPRDDQVETGQEPNEQSAAEDRLAPEMKPADQQEEPTAETTAPPDEPQSAVSPHALKQTLLQWHRPENGSVNYDPIPRKQLQRQLGWTQSEVQRMMKDVFGPKPFATYRQKCKIQAICDLLEDSGFIPTDPPEGSPDNADRQAQVAEMVSDHKFCQQIARRPRPSPEPTAKPTAAQPDAPSQRAKRRAKRRADARSRRKKRGAAKR